MLTPVQYAYYLRGYCVVSIKYLNYRQSVITQELGTGQGGKAQVEEV